MTELLLVAFSAVFTAAATGFVAWYEHKAKEAARVNHILRTETQRALLPEDRAWLAHVGWEPEVDRYAPPTTAELNAGVAR